ncbi:MULTISPECIES: hypothetical protein [unclassified Kitasatospora]|uniref:hypothetical protein n=1 Tax=unclassified Kitasatospora TaxID=2633591 RepID=UPI00367D9426
MRRTATVLAGVTALSSVFVSSAVAAPAEIVAPNARAAAQVSARGELERQKNVVDSFETPNQGVYCVIVDPAAGIDLSTALILANGGPTTTGVSASGLPTSSCNNRRDAITVVTLDNGRPVVGSFTIAVL